MEGRRYFASLRMTVVAKSTVTYNCKKSLEKRRKNLQKIEENETSLGIDPDEAQRKSIDKKCVDFLS